MVNIYLRGKIHIFGANMYFNAFNFFQGLSKVKCNTIAYLQIFKL